MKDLKVSVVIPALDGGEDLRSNMDALKAVRGWHELVVVVSGEDGFELERDGVKIVSCPVRNRSFQANMGAALAEGDALLFLTPETFLPLDTIVGMKEALKFPSCAGGGFALSFKKKSVGLNRIAESANRRGNRRSLFMWEQAIFVRRSVFDKIGGFGLTGKVDDYELCRAMEKEGTLVLLYPPVVVKGERFRGRGALTRLRYRLRGGEGFGVPELVVE